MTVCIDKRIREHHNPVGWRSARSSGYPACRLPGRYPKRRLDGRHLGSAGVNNRRVAHFHELLVDLVHVKAGQDTVIAGRQAIEAEASLGVREPLEWAVKRSARGFGERPEEYGHAR